MPLTLLVDIIDSVYRIALVSQEELVYLDADGLHPKVTLDSIYYARVIEKAPTQVVFELTSGVRATSRLEKSHPTLNVGKWVRVQVVREGFTETLGNQLIHKPVEVSQNLTFVHESLIFQPHGQGWTPRTGKALNFQQQKQVQEWFDQIQDSQTSGVLWQGPNSLERVVRDHQQDIQGIELASSDAVAYVRQACATYAPHLLSSIRLKTPKTTTLLEDWGYEDAWQDVLSIIVHTPQKGSLIFQTTAVATTIDVNTGGMSEDEANLTLCPQIAKHLMWRRLSGRVLIDFAGLHPKSRVRNKLVDLLKSQLKNDSPKWHILGWSNSGLLELQRERRRSALEQLGDFK